MKILFVAVPSPNYLLVPSAISILASITPKEHTIEIAVKDIGSISFDKKYDLVGISAMTPQVTKAYEIADNFRKRGQYVVMGGWHPSILPEEAKQHADTVVIGEAEDIWPQLLKDVENDMAKPFYMQEKPVDLKSLPLLRRDIYPKNTNLDIIATRGCSNKCEFCNISNQPLKKIYRMRPIKDVIDDIKLNPNKLFTFRDNSLTVNTQYTKQLFKEMKNLNKRFFAYGNINILGTDEELLKYASEAGCRGWGIGFESVSQNTLDFVGKPTNKVSNYLTWIKKIREYGMLIVGSFVFGFDTDTKDIFRLTDDFISKSDIEYPIPNILTPYPGTPLFDRLDKEGRILTKDWSKYNYTNVVFQPKYMTAEELSDSVKESSKKWFSAPNIIKRAITTQKYGIRVSASILLLNLGTKKLWKSAANTIFQK